MRSENSDCMAGELNECMSDESEAPISRFRASRRRERNRRDMGNTRNTIIIDDESDNENNHEHNDMEDDGGERRGNQDHASNASEVVQIEQRDDWPTSDYFFSSSPSSSASASDTPLRLDFESSLIIDTSHHTPTQRPGDSASDTSIVVSHELPPLPQGDDQLDIPSYSETSPESSSSDEGVPIGQGVFVTLNQTVCPQNLADIDAALEEVRSLQETLERQRRSLRR